MASEDVVAIVLAAGAAERMGEPKQLLAFRGAPLAEHAIAAAEASAVDHVVVVTGVAGDEVEAALTTRRAHFVRNPDPTRGNISSLACGADRADAAALVVLNADQPRITTETIDLLVATWRDRRPWAVVTQYRDRTGHPFLLSKAAAVEATGKNDPKRLGHLLIEHPDARVEHVVVDAPAPLDVNTPEDYRRLVDEDRGWPATPPRAT